MSKTAIAMMGLCGVIGCGSKKHTTPAATTTVSPFLPTAIEDMAKTVGTAVAGKGTPSATPIAVIANSNSALWSVPDIAVSRAAVELGVPPLYQEPSNAADQDAKLQGLLGEGSFYKGIALSVSDNTGAIAATATAPAYPVHAVETTMAGATVPFVTIDSDINPADVTGLQRLVYVGTDNTNAGVAVGKQIIKMLPNGGTVAILSSNGSNNIALRRNGIATALAGASNITVLSLPVATLSNSTTSCTATNSLYPASAVAGTPCITTDTEQLIAATPTLSLLVGLNTSGSENMGNGLFASGKAGTVQMIAFDASPTNLTHLANGTVQAILAQNAYWEAYLATYVLYANAVLGSAATLAILKPLLYGPNNDLVETGQNVITASNLSEFQAYLESLNVQAE